MEDLNKLHSFVRVAQRKSFTQAAHDLRLSPSAVTKQVSELEAQLKLSLLTRSTRGVALTEAGEELFARCGRILADLDDAILEDHGLEDCDAGARFLDLEIDPPMTFGAEYAAIKINRLDQVVNAKSGVIEAFEFGHFRLLNSTRPPSWRASARV